MPLQKLSEYRKLKRYSARLKVFEQETGMLLGYTENLHTEGMKLMSKEPIPDKKEIQIFLGDSDADGKGEKILLSVFRIWSGFSDTVPRFYYSGLHFIDPSDEALDSIQAIIDELSE